ncbi:TrkA C-terminal domain-containing protein [Natrialbaceae archaeon GCM10025810]|uniref:TrkA C-terminal domain-containing protein n=1 Tax=Halovalidus salilacus TaxID=3075124 RepID=UPI00361AC260
MIEAEWYDLLREAAIGVTGSTLLAATVGLLTAVGYRWMTTRAPPAGAAAFLGLSFVASYLSWTIVAAGTLLEGVALDHHFGAGYLLATFLLAGIVSAACGRLGDRIALQVTGLSRIETRGEAAATVRSARLAVDVTLPDRVEDAEGYRPVEPSVRRALSASTVRLPHGLSPSERGERIERHLEREYDVGYADVRMADDGTVDRVLVGRRASGLGSMLPPNAVAVAIRADPSPNACPGDPVEIRSAQEHDRGRLVATGTLRTANGSVATVIVDAERAADLSPDGRYRLVTHPDEPSDGYEFVSTLRTVDETVTAFAVETDGPLAGEFVGWLPGRVLVVVRDGDAVPMPDDSETLRAGDELWVLASPDALTAFVSANDGATVDIGTDEEEEPVDDRTGSSRGYDSTEPPADVDECSAEPA